MIEELRVKDYDNKNVKDYDTKSEVVAAYQEILHKLKENKKEAPEEDIHDEPKKRVIEILAKKPPEDFIKHFDQLKQSFTQTITELKDRFLAEQSKLADVVGAIELKNKELDHLHQIEVNANTLSALFIAQKEKSEKFEEEMTKRRHQFEQQMIQQRREWQQEEQKYSYQRDLTREKDAMQHKTKWLELEQEMESKRRNVEQELMTQQRKFNSELQERESRVIAGERELQKLDALKNQVAQFPQNIQEAVRRAEEATTKQLMANFAYETQLFNKELKIQEEVNRTLETKIALLESKITHFESLKNSLNRLAFNINDPNTLADEE